MELSVANSIQVDVGVAAATGPFVAGKVGLNGI